MTAWWAWVGHETGDPRWRSALVLAVLLAIGGGVVLSAFVGARRNATVVPRLAGAPARDRDGAPQPPGFDWEPVRELPYVRAIQLFAVSGFDVAGRPGTNREFPRASLPSVARWSCRSFDVGRVPGPDGLRRGRHLAGVSTAGPVSTSATN